MINWIFFFNNLLQNLKAIIKAHEHDLNRLKLTYNDLKLMIERVRGCKYDANGNEIASNNTNGLIVPFNNGADAIDQPAAEDFVKLDSLIEQLTERWNAAVLLYTQR